MRVIFRPAAGRSDPARAQDLLDGGQQPVAVLEHHAIELQAFLLIERAGLECLQIQADGRDRGLQLVCDRVDKRVVLFVAADLPHQKDCVQNNAADDESEQQDAEEQQDPGTPVQQHPADIENQDDGDQARPKGDEECNRLLPARDHHDSSLSRIGTGVHLYDTSRACLARSFAKIVGSIANILKTHRRSAGKRSNESSKLAKNVGRRARRECSA